MTNTPRRRWLRAGAAHAAGVAASAALPTIVLPARAAAAPRAERRLSLVHTHTRERIDLVYAIGQRRLPDAIAALNRFLRDHYTGEVGAIDPAVLDLLAALGHGFATRRPFEIVSAYRTAATNERLRRVGSGGVARRSLHMQGRAVDVRLPGIALTDLRDAARALKRGGVGFYPGSGFVHVDTGRVRTWQAEAPAGPAPPATRVA
ncbi:MAG: YcbK family protein [Lautropia sp.]